MFIVLGATGHIGSSVTRHLLAHRKEVTVVTRKSLNAASFHGAKIAEVDVYDTHALARLFETGTHLFLLNPPTPPSGDPADERRSLDSILTALESSRIGKVVAESTYGAQPGDDIGDLGVLYEMEERLKQLGRPTTLLRGAYYMTNWEPALLSSLREHRVQTLYPADFELPMVDPKDIGTFAAAFLCDDLSEQRTVHVEGPRKYSAQDVAWSLSQILRKPIAAETIPRNEWMTFLTSSSFSEKSARSMIKMTELTLAQKDGPTQVLRGRTTLEQFLKKLVDSDRQSETPRVGSAP